MTRSSFAGLQQYFSQVLAGLDMQNIGSSVAIACSGGADSMALVLLATAWCRDHALTPIVLTVDHALRPESAAEAQQVADWMKARGIEHHILNPVASDIHNLQHRAREMRYGALSTWCEARGIKLLLVAHHADDQAETVALQKHRGSSAPSRAGMAFSRQHGPVQLVRPLLGVRKQTLIDYLTAAGQKWIEDPTNQNDTYARNRLRQSMNDDQFHALWREAQLHGSQRYAEDRARGEWLEKYARMHDEQLQIDLPAWKALPHSMRTDVLSRCIQAVGQREHRPRGHETMRLDIALGATSTGKATLGHCIIRWQGDALLIAPEPLEAATKPPHIQRCNPLKQLADEQFWWFNHPLF